WIHGGAFIIGSPASPWYDPAAFVADGVVVVTISYRLGFEGLLPIAGCPTNRAVRDWLAAMGWVQECIAEFGGDPGNVTIAGQSAGSEACLTLLGLPAAQGLFHRVIAMSGAVSPREDYADIPAMTNAAARKLGVTADRAGLGSVPPSALLAAQKGIVGEFAISRRKLGGVAAYLRPTVDAELVPTYPLEAIAGGAGAGTALLLGVTAEEINAAARLSPHPLGQRDLETSLTRLGLGTQRCQDYLTEHAGRSRRQILGQALTDRSFRGPVARVAELRAATGAPTHSYEFRWRTPAWFGLAGACHCIDIPFAFAGAATEAKGPAAKYAPAELVATVHRACVGFVRDGNPGWPSYTSTRRTVMAFDLASGVVEDPWRLPRELWGSRRPPTGEPTVLQAGQAE
ncbi:MAG: carboxylesterase family protein, partial [Mycobacteriales bacterium]